MSVTARAYRHLLRELRKSSIFPPSGRNHAITAQFRAALFTRFVTNNDVKNAADFLRANRIHKELLERYNPLQVLTQEERVKATARRVGLDMPIHDV